MAKGSSMADIQENYQKLIQQLPTAFANHRIITDEKSGKPVDYIFLEVNNAFEEMTGLSAGNIIGKKVTEVLPGIRSSGFDWIGAYGEVAITGESINFEHWSEPLSRWYKVSAYKSGRIALPPFSRTSPNTNSKKMKSGKESDTCAP